MEINIIFTHLFRKSFCVIIQLYITKGSRNLNRIWSLIDRTKEHIKGLTNQKNMYIE